MSEKPSSERPVTFTEQEQLNLRNLESSGNELLNFKNTVLKGSFPGELSPGVLGLVNFLESLIQQAIGQINSIKESATKRSNSPKVEESSPVTKISVEQ